MELRSHLRSAAEDPAYAHLLQAHFFADRFEQFRRREHALDLMGLQQNERLLDDVLLVSLRFLNVAALEELDHPPRIKIKPETNSTTMLRQMLHREPQPPRTAGTHHDP